MKKGSPILTTAVIINTAILSILSILHFYWAFGGKLWYDAVLPTNSSGLNKLNPGTTATLIVALALLFLAFITFANIGFYHPYTKRHYMRYGALVIAIIFALRAIGDFKFVGFFKTVKSTRFAINDTYLFSPLCLFISLLSLLIFVTNKS